MGRIFFKVLVLSLFFSTGCVIDTSRLFSSPGPYQGIQDSCGFSVDEHSGKGVRWKKSKFPVIFKIHTEVPIKAEKNFISAVEHWNLAWTHYLEDKGLEPFDLYYVDRRGVYEGNAGPDGNNLFLFVHDNFSKYENPTSVQAITSLRVNKFSSNIEDTDILVNRENFEFFYDSSYDKEIELAHKDFQQKRFLASLRTPGPFVQMMNKIKSFFSFFLKPFKKAKPVRQIADYRVRVPRNLVDFPSLMIHELGHVPGRGHFNDDEYHTHFASREQRESKKKRVKSKNSHLSVMEPRLLRGNARRDITEYDLENLFCAYYNY